jgi:hypothetical protein
MGFKRRYKNFIEKFLSGEQGKRFFQVFYSLGAAVIIIGVLAKLMHWPYGLGNILLYVGFITEAIVFTISAFDTPTKEFQWDRVFPVLDTNEEEDRPSFGGGGNGSGSVVIGGGNTAGSVSTESAGAVAASSSKGSGGGGAVIIGGISGGYIGGGCGGGCVGDVQRGRFCGFERG